MDPNKTLNMTMLCDFYELTMGNGYLDHNMQDRITYFDVFFRSVPDDGGYAIAAGLEQIIDYIQNLHFTDEDIAYLRGRKLFSEAFLDYLKNCGAKCLRYIPRRIEDGYGLSKDAIQGLRDKGATLMITVDCGITAVEETEYLRHVHFDAPITIKMDGKKSLGVVLKP